MPRETLEISYSEIEWYLPGAQFLAMVAYPDPADEDERDKYCQALVKQTLERRMDIDPEWGTNLQVIRPGWLSGPDKLHDQLLNRGNGKLKKCQAVARYVVLPHLRALDIGRPVKVEGFLPTVNNMALLAARSLGMKDGSQATVKSRSWAPSKPVIHAMCAYIVWLEILWDMWARNPEADRLLAFRMLPEFVSEVVDIAEHFRLQLIQIRHLNISEDQTIQFSMVPEVVQLLPERTVASNRNRP